MATPTPRDAVTVVIPVHNAADRLDKLVTAWAAELSKLHREYEILVVDDGSTDATAAALEKLAPPRIRNLRTLRHDVRRGFGACLRTAVTEAQHPLLFYTSADYPYNPADLRKLLERIDVRDEILGKQPDLISGCRTGRPAPAPVRWFGQVWRFILRVAVGMQFDPAPTWLGLREWLHRCFVGWVFGVPLTDVNSAFKLYRTAFLKRVPIQSDSDFVHVELVAKATFLTSIMDELPLTPRPDPVPRAVWRDMWHVFTEPEFGTPTGSVPGAPGGMNPPVQAPVEGSRDLAPPPPAAPPPTTLAIVPAG